MGVNWTDAWLYAFPPQATNRSQISPKLPRSGVSKEPRFPLGVKTSAPTPPQPWRMLVTSDSPLNPGDRNRTLRLPAEGNRSRGWLCFPTSERH